MSDPFDITQKLSKDDLALLHAFTKSAVWPIYLKMVGIYRHAEMEALSNADADEFRRIQGRIQGLDMLKGLPMLQAQIHERITLAEKAKEEAKNPKKKGKKLSNP